MDSKIAELLRQGHITYDEAHALLAALVIARENWDEGHSIRLGTVAASLILEDQDGQ
jgi:hypothetical protein